MTVAEFPDIPSRGHPSFNAAMNAFVTRLHSLPAELNQFVPLLDAYDDVIAAANYKGLWSGLAGALAIPASVYHSGRMWVLLQNVADVTTKVPGVATEWVVLHTTAAYQRIYSSSQTFAKVAGVDQYYVITVDGGYGGGQYVPGQSGSHAFGLVTLTADVQIVIGAGGAGGTASTNPQPGGLTSFGTFSAQAPGVNGAAMSATPAGYASAGGAPGSTPYGAYGRGGSSGGGGTGGFGNIGCCIVSWVK